MVEHEYKDEYESRTTCVSYAFWVTDCRVALGAIDNIIRR